MNELPLLVQPLRPRAAGWVQEEFRYPRSYGTPYAIERWYNASQETAVLSAIEVVKPEGPQEARPEYHVSVSGLKPGASTPYRCSDSRAQWALRQFGFDGSFEDNHVPHGIVRNFWRPVAEPLVGQECACVAEEPAMREMKGDFTWRGVGR